MPHRIIDVKNTKIAPTIVFDVNELPEIKEWEVGHKYKLSLDVEQIGVDKGFDGKDPLSGRFRVLRAKSMGEMEEDKVKSEKIVMMKAIKRRTYK